MNLIPSPQISVQVSFAAELPPDQVHPDSTDHTEFQPSLFTILPSSQYVVKILNRLLSPQISVHVSFFVEVPPDHFQPLSIAQILLQPSLLLELPSSQ